MKMIQQNLIKFIFLSIALLACNVAYSQTTNLFFGIPINNDFVAAAEELKKKDFEVIGYSNDSIALAGTLLPFGDCNIVLYEKTQKITFKSNVSVDSAIKEIYGSPIASEGNQESYFISSYNCH